MTTKEILTAARGFIKEGWTKDNYACDEDGLRQWPTSPQACRWCAVGSLYATLGIHKDDRNKPNKSFDGTLNYLNNIVRYFGDYTVISDFNDNPETTKEDILAVFDEAIKRCKDDK